MKIFGFAAVVLAAVFGSAAWSAENHHEHHSSASAQGPIGVMGTHLHEQGKWMASYRYMRMEMQGNRIGSRRVPARDIVGTGMNPGQFIVAPTAMPMEMHMLGAMYGLTDNITLMGMTSFVSNEMDHLVRNGRRFTTESSGVGDSKLAALISIYSSHSHAVHLNLGLSLPTGSTDERDDTPVMANAILPYPMQLGSGTYDLLPGITYRGYREKWNWGVQASATVRTGTNGDGYTVGDRINLTSWLAFDVFDYVSVSARLNHQDWDNIDGVNPALNPMMVQTANTELQGGDRTDLSLGANYKFGKDHRLSLEYAEPISQNLNGPQLETDWVVTAGWQKSF